MRADADTDTDTNIPQSWRVEWEVIVEWGVVYNIVVSILGVAIKLTAPPILRVGVTHIDPYDLRLRSPPRCNMTIP